MAPSKSPVFLCFAALFITLSGSRPISDQTRPVYACDLAGNPGLGNFSFCDPSLGLKARVKDLVGRLTLQEKIGWLVSGSRGVSRLGIPSYEWWSEALHGVSATGQGTVFRDPVPAATSFPQVILMAATFNVSLFEAIGKVVSTEARAMHNVGLTGLTFWSPNVNIFRDPRWGRGQETPGEDPLLSSKYGAAYVRGLQETDDGDKDKLKVAACCKHYTAYDLDNWNGVHRFTFNAVVTKQDLEDTYQPPFKSCVVEGNVASVMCSYQQVNGKPTCGDPVLLTGVIRDEWNLNGYIVSDCDSLSVMFGFQHYTKTPEETAALAVKSGLDLNCGYFLLDNAQAAVERGLLKEKEIDRAISNNFVTMMRLGFFDGDPTKRAYGNLGPQDVCTSSNQELALEAARQGIVLLKNTKGSLPLSPTRIKSLAVIGPNANVTRTMIGNYEGEPCKYTTPLQGLTAHVPTVYNQGCAGVACGAPDLDSARRIASETDAVVLVVGSDQSIEKEDLDRTSITLPGQQQLLVTEVTQASRGPVILVIMSGGGMDVQFAKDNPEITSILWVGFPGQAGGAALADVVFGYHNPSGRLPMTWYPQSYADSVNMTDMNMRPDPARGYPGRTYRFYTGPTVFSFGYGIGYTQFHHELIKAPTALVAVPIGEKHACRASTCESLDSGRYCKYLAFEVRLGVKNVGRVSGTETVLLFSTPPVGLDGAPRKQMVGFERVELGAGEARVVRFGVDVCKDLSVVDGEGNRRVALGEHVLQVGEVTHSLTVRV